MIRLDVFAVMAASMSLVIGIIAFTVLSGIDVGLCSSVKYTVRKAGN